MAPGILYVTMQPSSNLEAARFQDWYNNEHGPLRLRLASFVENGFRYRATDLDGPGKGKPEWMAIYDITDMDELNGKEYLKLRGDPVQSQRERNLRPDITIDRRSFDFVREWKADDFTHVEQLGGRADTDGNVLISVSFSLATGHTADELEKWYNEEHVSMLQKVPGWRRTRRFVTAAIDKKPEAEKEYLALHEYAPQNGLGGPEFKAATGTPWARAVTTNVVSAMRRRVYSLHYTFGPAPRDLNAIAQPGVPAFASPATGTRTFPDSTHPALESYVTTPDGAILPYRLEGNPSATAPLLVLSNSILTTWGIWDAFVAHFLSTPHGSSYRILRYLTRGRTSHFGTAAITVPRLAGDIVTLLDALRVPKAAAAVGVSLGGATVLCAGLDYPERVSAFVSCDTSAKSPAGNSKAWSERIEVAEGEGAKGTAAEAVFTQAGWQASAEGRTPEDEHVVGEKLAEMTVSRWFVPSNHSAPAFPIVKQMVHDNSLDGFKASVRALWEYDLRPKMGAYVGKGAFLVGEGDGALPKSMREMAGTLGERGSECFGVEEAGHLPMVERPDEVVKAVVGFLER